MGKKEHDTFLPLYRAPSSSIGKLRKVANSLIPIDPRLAMQAQAVLGEILDSLLLKGVQAQVVSSEEVVEGPMIFETPRGCRVWIGYGAEDQLFILGLNPRVRPILNCLEENKHVCEC
jgi:hypothetical protein